MWTAIYIVGAMALWGAWGALGMKAFAERTAHQGLSDIEKELPRNALVSMAPIAGTYQIARWLLWRYSERGRHEIERRRLERQRELEERYDEMLEE